MAGDDRKPSFSELDRRRREGGARPQGGKARAEDARRTRAALEAADALFVDEPGGEAGQALAAAVREAHGTPGLAEACRAYVDALGVPTKPELLSIFLDAGDKALSVAALDALLAARADGAPPLTGGLRRQVRILAEDFDDDLASRAEELLEGD